MRRRCRSRASAMPCIRASMHASMRASASAARTAHGRGDFAEYALLRAIRAAAIRAGCRDARAAPITPAQRRRHAHAPRCMPADARFYAAPYAAMPLTPAERTRLRLRRLPRQFTRATPRASAIRCAAATFLRHDTLRNAFAAPPRLIAALCCAIRGAAISVTLSRHLALRRVSPPPCADRTTIAPLCCDIIIDIRD